MHLEEYYGKNYRNWNDGSDHIRWKREPKPGEAAHFAAQLMDSVEARAARNAPNWVAAAAAVLTDGNKEEETTPEPAEEPSAEKTRCF